jgi:hypothetical protein
MKSYATSIIDSSMFIGSMRSLLFEIHFMEEKNKKILSSSVSKRELAIGAFFL